MPIPIALMVDDCAPVNTMFFHDPPYEHPLLIPNSAEAGVDALLSADGAGRIPEVVGQGCPVVILTHWQSLYSDGTCAGLWGLGELLSRLHQRYAGDLAWTTCGELAEQAAAEHFLCKPEEAGYGNHLPQQ